MTEPSPVLSCSGAEAFWPNSSVQAQISSVMLRFLAQPAYKLLSQMVIGTLYTFLIVYNFVLFSLISNIISLISNIIYRGRYITLRFYQNLLYHLKKFFTPTGKRCLKTPPIQKKRALAGVTSWGLAGSLQLSTKVSCLAASFNLSLVAKLYALIVYQEQVRVLFLLQRAYNLNIR